LSFDSPKNASRTLHNKQTLKFEKFDDSKEKKCQIGKVSSGVFKFWGHLVSI